MPEGNEAMHAPHGYGDTDFDMSAVDLCPVDLTTASFCELLAVAEQGPGGLYGAFRGRGRKAFKLEEFEELRAREGQSLCHAIETCLSSLPGVDVRKIAFSMDNLYLKVWFDVGDFLEPDEVGILAEKVASATHYLTTLVPFCHNTSLASSELQALRDALGSPPELLEIQETEGKRTFLFGDPRVLTRNVKRLSKILSDFNPGYEAVIVPGIPRSVARGGSEAHIEEARNDSTRWPQIVEAMLPAVLRPKKISWKGDKLTVLLHNDLLDASLVKFVMEGLQSKLPVPVEGGINLDEDNLYRICCEVNENSLPSKISFFQSLKRINVKLPEAIGVPTAKARAEVFLNRTGYELHYDTCLQGARPAIVAKRARAKGEREPIAGIDPKEGPLHHFLNFLVVKAPKNFLKNHIRVTEDGIFVGEACVPDLAGYYARDLSLSRAEALQAVRDLSTQNICYLQDVSLSTSGYFFPCKKETELLKGRISEATNSCVYEGRLFVLPGDDRLLNSKGLEVQQLGAPYVASVTVDGSQILIPRRVLLKLMGRIEELAEGDGAEFELRPMRDYLSILHRCLIASKPVERKNAVQQLIRHGFEEADYRLGRIGATPWIFVIARETGCLKTCYPKINYSRIYRPLKRG